MSDKGDTCEDRERATYTRDGGKPNANGGGPSLGKIFECLTSTHRRHTLYHLQEHEIAEVDELATHIITQEAGIPSEEVSTDQREQIKIQLVHTHLPKLAAVNCLEYDPRSSTVRYTEPPALLDQALRLLSQLEGHEE